MTFEDAKRKARDGVKWLGRSIKHAPSVLVSKELDHAVMLAVMPGGFTCNDVGVQLGIINQKTIDDENTRLHNLRLWLATQTDLAVVNAYNRWISFYEDGVRAAQHAIDTNARENWEHEIDKRRKEFDELKHRADELNIPRPGKI